MGEEPGHTRRRHRAGPCEAEGPVGDQQAGLTGAYGEQGGPGGAVEGGAGACLRLGAAQDLARLAGHPDRAHPIAPADAQHRARDQRVDVEMLVGVDVIEGQAGRPVGLELRFDLGGELAPRGGPAGEIEPELGHVGAQQAIRPGEIGKRGGRQGRPRLDQHEMQPDPE